MTEALHFDGLRVIDLTRLLPGPICSLLFADLGADVVKIEDTGGGDYARYYPPMNGDYGAFFAAVNRNKRSMKLNLKSEEGVAILKEMVKGADVLLESFRPGVMERLGVGWDELRTINPRLVYCAISGYGQTGPYRDRAGHDINYVAKTGLLDQTGKKGGPVVVPGFQLADIGGGALYAAFGVTSALYARERTGEGSFVDISMTEGALTFAMPAIANMSGGEQQVRGDNMLTGGVPCYDVYETADGRYLSVGPLEPKFWAGFVQAIERPDLVSDSMSRSDDTRQKVQEALRTKTLAQWQEIFDVIDVCVEPVKTFEEVLEDEHHRARKMFFELAGVQHVRTPVTPVDRSHEPAPAHGEHTDAVLRELGKSDDEIDALREAGVV